VPGLTPAQSSGGGKKQTTESDNPKAVFVNAALGMSWQLAVVVLLPIIGGYELDQHTKTSPLFTLVGFIVAGIAACLIVWKTLIQYTPHDPKNGGKT